MHPPRPDHRDIWTAGVSTVSWAATLAIPGWLPAVPVPSRKTGSASLPARPSGVREACSGGGVLGVVDSGARRLGDGGGGEPQRRADLVYAG